jgi:RNA polymerase sigma-70 factor (ECF subfamily)
MNRNEQASLFKAWAEQYAGLMGRVARAYTFSTEDCKDLVQEILLQVWRSLPCFEGRASASTWIYRVALNTALAWQRKDRRRQARFRPLPDAEAVSEISDSTPGAMAAQERLEQLYAAIRQLPKADAALVLLYLDDLTYREIAEVCGLSENHVGVKLNRARKALAELMKEVAHES